MRRSWSRPRSVDEIPRARLPVAPRRSRSLRRCTRRSARRRLATRTVGSRAHGNGSRMRAARSPRDAPAFHGSIGPWGRVCRRGAWSVSALETYLGCPFKFFAQHVLRLEEEPDDEEVMDPRTQGQFVHEVFEALLQALAGRGAPGDHARHDRPRALGVSRRRRNVPRTTVRHRGGARADTTARFAGGRRSRRGRVSAWRPNARCRSWPGCSSTGSRATFTFDTAGGPAPPVAERQGGSHRPPRRRHVPADRLQARLAAEQRAGAAAADLRPLRGAAAWTAICGRRWTLGEAVYLAFKGPKRVVPLFSSPADRDEGARRRAAAAGRYGRRDRARRVSADTGRCVSLRDLQLRRGVPEGLRRRCLTAGCRSTTPRGA